MGNKENKPINSGSYVHTRIYDGDFVVDVGGGVNEILLEQFGHEDPGEEITAIVKCINLIERDQQKLKGFRTELLERLFLVCRNVGK